MKGKHHIVIESPRLKYEFDIKRNITIIQGESATGKTTLIELLSDYQIGGGNSPIRIEADVPCVVLGGVGDRWESVLESITDSIVFIDEENHYIRSKEFAKAVQESSNYFVLITREALPALPYSVQEIYGIRTSGKFHFPEKVYHEFYPIYGDVHLIARSDKSGMKMITEDSDSGNQFFSSFFRLNKNCIGAGGNSKIYAVLRAQDKNQLLCVVADGAAFGAFISRVLEYAKQRERIILYLPESFEWLLLKAGVISDKDLVKILETPESFIESSEYMSWEQFFTELLEERTKNDALRRYQKSELRPYYLGRSIKAKVLRILPDELRKCLENEEKCNQNADAGKETD